MWSARHAACCLVATLLAGGTSAAAAAEPEETLDAAAVARAYATVRGWLDDFSLPAPEDPAAAVPLDGSAGVCILLRRGSRVVAAGTDAQPDDRMLRRAAGRAFGALLADPGRPRRPGAEAGRRVTLELEVAGPLRPLLGRTADRLVAGLEPGLDGLALRRGEDVAMIFPAQARVTGRGADPARLAPGLAQPLGLPPSDLGTMIDRFAVTAYRFRTVDLFQPTPDRPPVTLFRGQHIVPGSAVTARRLATLADAIAGHILDTRFTPPPGEPPAAVGFHGDYEPRTDTYDPFLATPLEQALLCLALGRYARLDEADPGRAAVARRTGREVLAELALVEPRETDPLASPAACAAVAWAAVELAAAGEDPRVGDLLDGAVARLIAAPAAGDATLHPHALALGAAASARMLRAGDGRFGAADVRARLDAAWAAAPGGAALILLPWIGWGETEYAAATGGPLRHADRLRELRGALDLRRVGGTELDGPPDLDGGFDLTLGAVGPRPRATDQTFRPAAFLATMLREPDLTTPEERWIALGRHQETLRFLLQLCVDEDTPWPLRGGRRARGGIRAATWETRQPAAGQALALLTAAETLTSLRVLARPGTGEDAPPEPESPPRVQP